MPSNLMLDLLTGAAHETVCCDKADNLAALRREFTRGDDMELDLQDFSTSQEPVCTGPSSPNHSIVSRSDPSTCGLRC